MCLLPYRSSRRQYDVHRVYIVLVSCWEHTWSSPFLLALVVQVIKKVEEFKPQELANVVWAFASMEHYSPELMTVVGERALLMRDQFKEQELSNVVWAFAKLHHYDEALFKHMLSAVASKLPHFLPQVRVWMISCTCASDRV